MMNQVLIYSKICIQKNVFFVHNLFNPCDQQMRNDERLNNQSLWVFGDNEFEILKHFRENNLE